MCYSDCPHPPEIDSCVLTCGACWASSQWTVAPKSMHRWGCRGRLLEAHSVHVWSQKLKWESDKPNQPWGRRRRSVPVVKGTWRRYRGMAQVSSTPHLQGQVLCRNVSFVFERMTETREFHHLGLQIMRLVAISLPCTRSSFWKGGRELTSSPH